MKINQRRKLRLFYIITEWKPIHYFACGLETPLRTTAKSKTYMNHDISQN